MFTFGGYEIKKEEGVVTFKYELAHKGETFSFAEKIIFDPARADFSRVSEKVLLAALDTLSLILGVSYWKLFCSKEIRLPHIKLSRGQAEFWNTVYTKGLGEFFYKNKIDFRGLVNPVRGREGSQRSSASNGVNFPSAAKKVPRSQAVPKTGKTLVLWGGGKDSIVSAELLKKDGKDFDLFSLNDYPIQRETAKIAGKELLVVKREIDPKLLELNKRPDVYNGHVPVSVVYSSTALVAAILYGYDSIVNSCEKSANYGNVEYLGETVNHQWSKSEEFEKMFRDYIKTYITSTVTYSSLLRQYSELQIAELFSKYPRYFSSFASCNKNFTIAKPKGNRWCGECAKCAFVFAILSAYLPKDTLVKIFGKNLFSDPALLTIYRKLWGLEAEKPFDCVGTPEETLAAFELASKTGAYKEDVIMKGYESR